MLCLLVAWCSGWIKTFWLSHLRMILRRIPGSSLVVSGQALGREQYGWPCNNFYNYNDRPNSVQHQIPTEVSWSHWDVHPHNTTKCSKIFDHRVEFELSPSEESEFRKQLGSACPRHCCCCPSHSQGCLQHPHFNTDTQLLILFPTMFRYIASPILALLLLSSKSKKISPSRHISPSTAGSLSGCLCL